MPRSIRRTASSGCCATCWWSRPSRTPSNQISQDDARRRHPAAQVGDTIADPLPPLEYGRIAAQSAKQVIVQKVREAERDRQYEEYKDRISDIVNGIVKRVEYGNVIVDLGRGEAIVRRDEMLPREVFRNGDRIRAFIYDVRRETRGPQIFLSRTHPQFMAKLFAQEVPEIYDGIVEVRAVARDPGSRAKIAVISRDSSVDPVGACVGMRGSRVQAVVNELQGEKIDIIPWTHDPANFVVNALAPAEVAKVVLDEDRQRMEVVVPDQQLSLAIGRRGQNVRLASQLTGWDIDIVTEQEESENRQAEFEKRTKLFIDSLNVDEVVGQLLASEGFKSVEELAMVDEKEIAGIEGFDEETAGELQNRAREFLAAQEAELDTKRKELGVEDALRGRAGRHHRDARQARRGRHQDGRGSRRLRHRRSVRLERAQGRRNHAFPRHARRLRAVARRGRGADHAGPRQGRLGQGRRPRAAAAEAARGSPGGNRTGAGVRSDRNDDARTADRMTHSTPGRARPRTARSACAPSTGTVRPVDDMIRFVLSPEGTAVPDLKRRLPGRGVWITATRSALGHAIARKAFARSFKRDVRIAPDLVDVDRAPARTGRARRARDRLQGEAGGGGFRQGRSGIGAGQCDRAAACLGCRPRRGAKARRHPAPERPTVTTEPVAVLNAFTSAQLDLALGRSNVVHAALLAGPESKAVLTRVGAP